MVPWAHMSQPPKGIWIGSAVFAYIAQRSQCFSAGRTTPNISLPLGKFGPHLIHGSLGPPESTAYLKRHLDQYSRFFRAQERDQHTDRPRYFICIAIGRYRCDAT